MPLSGPLWDRVRLEIADVYQGVEGQTSPNAAVGQPVDHYSRTTPGGTGGLDESLTRQCLTPGIDPIVDEQHTIAALEEVSPEAERELAVAVVRGCPSMEPCVAVGQRFVVFPHFNEPNP